MRLWNAAMQWFDRNKSIILKLKGFLRFRDTSSKLMNIKPSAVLTGHTWSVDGALETRGGRFLSWSVDHTLRLWDAAGQPLAVLTGHEAGVSVALETRDGRFLSWSAEYDQTLRLWDAAGQPLDCCPIEEGLCRYDEFRTKYLGNNSLQ